jgi:DNA sulfur modification protein DndC
MGWALPATLAQQVPRGVLDDGRRLECRLAESAAALRRALDRGLDHWVLMYSGGKDSTTVAVVTLETVRRERLPVRALDLVYTDTRVEIPLLAAFARRFLAHLQAMAQAERLPLTCTILEPPLAHRFWVRVLGMGYPPPHQRFRWCTRLLTSAPVQAWLARRWQPGRTGILTGVRFGESAVRDGRLLVSCRRGGECGQGHLFRETPAGLAYLAPLIAWKECDVWDFLTFVAPAWGYETAALAEEVYPGRDTRFGCWCCTVVENEKTLTRLADRDPRLRALVAFRALLWARTRDPASRYPRPDGTPGRLTLETRRHLLGALLQAQRATGLCLCTREERAAIRRCWADPRYGPYAPDADDT